MQIYINYINQTAHFWEISKTDQSSDTLLILCLKLSQKQSIKSLAKHTRIKIHKHGNVWYSLRPNLCERIRFCTEFKKQRKTFGTCGLI